MKPFNNSTRSIVVALTLALLLGVGACSSDAQSSRATPQAATSVVATIGETKITLAEVDRRALRRDSSDYGGMTIAQAMYEARKATLSQMISNELIAREAAKQQIDPAELAQREITAKIVPPTEAEISAWYSANPEQVQNATLDQVREPIRQLLMQQRHQEAEAQFVGVLKAATAVTVALAPPREEVAANGRPARGASDAVVEIVEFSDFQCPFCLRSQPTISQILDRYGSSVRLVYRHFPLPNHADAWPAAEASMCAADQGKFWEYHDHLFANQDKLSLDGLKQQAAAVGLDTAAFNACVDSRKYEAEVQTDVDAGRELGITGTPSFFINGRLLGGAQPFPVFQQIIDEELAR